MTLVSADDLISGEQKVGRPHVVILGAGASLAAFPQGDANGRRLPLMWNLIQTLGLQEQLLAARPSLKEDRATCERWCNDFEACFSELHDEDPGSALIKQIEAEVRNYFSQMQLPEHATLYDLLVLSLAQKDAIFSFNWDPFLADAWERNQGVAELPPIFHLHGNVRLTYCRDCDRSHLRMSHCVECGKATEPTPLLYPVKDKDYKSDPFIKGQWDAAREYLADALVVTVFGYSAPETDVEAKAILKEAWKGEGQVMDSSHNIAKRVNVIDTKDPGKLRKKWEPFQTYSDSNRIDISKSVADTFLGRYPRRSCEALRLNAAEGLPTTPFPVHQSLEDLQSKIRDIAAHESHA